MFEYNVTFIYNNATDNKIGGVIVLSYFFPSSFDLFIQPTIASMILFLNPSFSSIATASIVVPASLIVETALKEHAKVIGLSALMTTTMMRMKDVVELAKEMGCSSKIVIGGAAINESFADEIGADGYSKDAADCVKLVDRLLEE